MKDKSVELEKDGPFKAGVEDLNIENTDIEVEFVTTHGSIIKLYGDLKLNIDKKDYYRGYGYVDKLKLEGSDLEVPLWIVEDVNDYLADVDVSDQLVEHEAGRMEHLHDCYQDR